MITDTHVHLYSEEFRDDIDDIMQRAMDEKVSRFYLPAIDSSTHEAMIGIENKFAGKCFAMIGLHPCSVKENYRSELAVIEDLLRNRKFIGIGETGLDFYWDNTFVKEQYEALEQQIQWALDYKLPLILHTRNATQETIDVIKKYSATNLKGIFHCFGGSVSEAEQIISAGFYLGIGGVITYKNSGLAEVLKNISMDHIVLETDAPYLSPVPKRGKRNESSYLTHIVKKLAETKNISEEDVMAITTLNAAAVFS